MKKAMMTILTLAIFTATTFAASPAMIRLEMNEKEQGTEVKVNLPFSLLEVVKPQIEEALGNAELNGEVDIKAIWAELKAAGSHEFVNVKSADATVVVSTNETHVLVQVEGEGKNMNLSAPIALGDLLFSSDTVDVTALMEGLKEFQGQDLLTITGDQVDLKIWID